MKIKNILLLTICLMFFFVLPAFANESLEILLDSYYNKMISAESLETLIMSSYSRDCEVLGTLAFIYLNRNRVKSGDIKKAFELFEKSALLGDDNSQRILAYCYYKGKGIPKDDIMAYAYFNIVLPFYKNREAERIQNISNFKKITEFFGKGNVQYYSDRYLGLYCERDDESPNATTNDARVYAYSNFDSSIYKKLKIKHIQMLNIPLKYQLSIKLKEINYCIDDSPDDIYFIDVHITRNKIGFQAKLTLPLLEVDDKFFRKIAPPVYEGSKFTDASVISDIEKIINKILQEMTPVQIEKAKEVSKELIMKIEKNKNILVDTKKH